MGTVYKMHKSLFSFGEDFWIETQDGRAAFKVDGQALSMRDTFTLADASGTDLYRAQRSSFIGSGMRIESGDGVVAELHKKFQMFTQRFRIDLADGSQLEVTDNITNHEYRILRGGEAIAAVSKQWFSVPQSFGVEIGEGEDDALLLAITVCLDEIIEREERRR